MREIKFRQFYDGGVHYWGYEHLSESKNPVFTGPVLGQRGFIESQQFTGLKDKSGTEIYESDIVEYSHSNKSKGRVRSVVIFDKCGFTVAVNDSILKDDSVLLACTVIGNIYQNPELLNG